MLAAALSIAWMSVLGRAAGFFSRPMATFGIVVAVALLAALAFVPIAALWIWCVIISVQLIRKSRRQPTTA
jgi:formate hydrogenlyase subunit 3/multisubunit Na+/H+ antiporter MnhD subunit